MKQSSTAQSTRGRKAKSNSSTASSKTGSSSQSGASSSRTSQAGNREKSSQKENSSSSRTTAQTSQNKNQRGSGPGGASSRMGGADPSTRQSSLQSSHSGSNFQGSSHLEKFFLDQLHDIYYAEQKITKSLPKMQEAATTEELKDAFEDHLRQTQRHIKRLEKVFETLGRQAEGKKCEAIEGISREVESIIEETEEGSMTRDAALIMAAQKVEHYEIATYGGLVQLAITMQLHDAADLLDKTLMEEEDTDALLTEIAENEINLRAEHEGSHDEWSTREGQEGGQDQDASEEEGQEAGESDETGEEEDDTESE